MEKIVTKRLKAFFSSLGYIFLEKQLLPKLFFTYLLKFILLIYGENHIFSPIEKRLKIDISVIFILIFLERKAKK